MNDILQTRVIVTRVSQKDAHYGGGVVDGAFIMRLFGDALTYVTARADSDEGLLASYRNVTFHNVVRPGDFVSVSVVATETTRLSRTYQLTATIDVRAGGELGTESTATTLEETLVAATAEAKIVIPRAAARRRETEK
ncbi:3-aminobutyryl-CoA ammonia-lyase [Kocuria marina]|uniref:3-aminobutyryl-CoA ammonia-lyase n=1 Tax=Kocuria marina TaxID=223184 RepID=UPI0034603156